MPLLALFLSVCAGLPMARMPDGPAPVLEMRVARAVAPEARLEGLRLTLGGDAASTLRIEAARAVVPRLGLDGGLAWSCTLVQGGDDARACAGPLAWSGSAAPAVSASLAARVDAETLELVFSQGEREIALELPFAADAAARASLRQIPVDWLAVPLAAVRPGAALEGGTLAGHAEHRADGRIDVRFEVDALDVGDGGLGFSGRGLNAKGWARWAPAADGARATGGVELLGGRLEGAGVAVELPASPVTVAIDAGLRGSRWDLARVAWSDPGTLLATARGAIDPAAQTPLQALELHMEATLPAALDRYAGGVAGAGALAALEVAGGVAADVVLGPDGLERLGVDASGVDVVDPDSGASMQGLDAQLDWRAAGEGAVTRFGWRGGHVAGIAIPAAGSALQARAGRLHQVGSLRVALPGGVVELAGLRLDPRLVGDWLAGRFRLENLGWDSEDGTLAVAGATAQGRFAIGGSPAVPEIRIESALRGGEFLAGPVYVKLPDAPVSLAATLAAEGDGWRIGHLEWRDPGVLELSGGAEVSPTGPSVLRSLQLEARVPDLDAALSRYGRSWLDARGFRGLAARGALSATLAMGAAGLERAGFSAEGVDLVDAQGRFRLRGLAGAVDWRASGRAAPTTLAWQGLELYRLPFDAARLQLALEDHALVLQQPVEVGILGGALRLEKLSLLPRSQQGERYVGSFAIAGIQMAELSEVLGWPRFGGNLSGGIPEIEFAGDRIRLRGGLDLYVFDGHVGVSGVALERPFGVAPSLDANIHFENLDLDQVTRAFDFGGMTGRLSGSIKALRLVDWSPVAFDASLRTAGGGRMSYNAVNDISSIGGGGGLGASLQTMALGLFDTFGYSRLGIRCLLRDEVCRMAGIEPMAADPGNAGYTIVEGSGLPRITIIGHQRRVDWPTLVRRLAEATHGGGPVIH